MPKTLPSVARIARYTIFDEVRQKSFIAMFAVCALCVFLVRGCYHGDYMVNGQYLDAGTIVRAVSKVVFHIIGAGAMVVAGLFSMRIFSRDRSDGTQSCILSKAISRRQYVAGKVLGVWMVSLLFMSVLHGIVFLVTSISVGDFMPGYLAASLICSVNLLFVVLAVLLLSLLMPDIVAFLCVLGVGVAGFLADGIAAVSQSQVAHMVVRQPGAAPHGDLTWWKVVYYAWPKLLAVQQEAASLFGSVPFQGFGSLYPFVNVLLYCLVLGAALVLRFGKEDIG